MRHIGTFLVMAVAALGGCTTMHKSYPESSPAQVWSAMVTVAHQPRYRDWEVLFNDVAVDEQHQRLDISRTLFRRTHDPVSEARTERREWKFTVWLEATAPPTVAFESTGMAVPAHAQEEANRYFADVYTVLTAGGPVAGRPEPEVPPTGDEPDPVLPPAPE